MLYTHFRVSDLTVITTGVDELKGVFAEIKKLQQLERMRLTQRKTGAGLLSPVCPFFSVSVCQFELGFEHLGQTLATESYRAYLYPNPVRQGSFKFECVHYVHMSVVS